MRKGNAYLTPRSPSAPPPAPLARSTTRPSVCCACRAVGCLLHVKENSDLLCCAFVSYPVTGGLCSQACDREFPSYTCVCVCVCVILSHTTTETYRYKLGQKIAGSPLITIPNESSQLVFNHTFASNRAKIRQCFLFTSNICFPFFF